MNEEQNIENETIDEQIKDNQVLDELGEIKSAIKTLQLCFDARIKNDEHKEKLFDKMHQELTDYRNGVNEQNINSVALEIIQVIDVLKRDRKNFSYKECTEENYKKMLTNYERVINDLEDILYRQNIEPYEVDGKEIDVKKQKIVGTVATAIECENNQLAEKLACGYDKNGKVIRAERIKVKKYISEDTN